MSQGALQFQDVSRVYRSGDELLRAVDKVSFSVHSGEFVALCGPSGCGKSTILNMAGLADAPSEGEISFDGVRVNHKEARALLRYRRTYLGYVFQQFNLLPTLTALENVCLTAILAGIKRPTAEADALRLLERVGLEKRRDHLPSHLSGGEMQRVALCRAVIHRPRLLLADEPTGNLDSQSGEAVLTLLREFALEGTAILMATHSTEALSYTSRVIQIRDGKRLG